jgi:hypothetical protein
MQRYIKWTGHLMLQSHISVVLQRNAVYYRRCFFLMAHCFVPYIAQYLATGGEGRVPL